MKIKKIGLDLGLIGIALFVLLFELFKVSKNACSVCFVGVSFITLFYLFLSSIRSFSKKVFLKDRVISLGLFLFSSILLYFFARVTFFEATAGMKQVLFYCYFLYLFVLICFFASSLRNLIRKEGALVKNIRVAFLSLVSFEISLMSFVWLLSHSFFF